MRQLAKRLLRPFLLPILRRLDARVAAYAARREDVEAMQAYLPILLDVISSQNAAAREARRVETGLVERVRRLEQELADRSPAMGGAEAAAGPGAPSHTNGTSQIVHPAKLAVRPIRLNLGCGEAARDGYVNVETQPLPGVDVVTDLAHLPFAAGEVDEIFSAHLLQRLPGEELRATLLPHWLTLLRPGAALVGLVPASGLVAGELLRGLLHDAGFVDVEVEASAQGSDDGDLVVSARKPESAAAATC